MPTEISGSTGVNKIQDNTIVNADINSSAAIAGTKLVMPSGSLLQVVTSEFSTDTSTTNTSLTATGHTVSITPSSTSSKIYVMLSGSGGYSLSNGWWIGALYRGSTNISTGMGYTQYYSSTEGNATYSYNVMDLPSTTSAITYQMYYRSNHSNNTAYYRWSDKGNPLLTAMEIAG
jgi:hypothetical protein